MKMISLFLLLTSLAFAQTELRTVDQSKLPDYARIDIESLNELNLRATSMDSQEQKESFKFFIVSTPFQVKRQEKSIVTIRGQFEQNLIRSIAQLMIEEMENVDRLSPVSFPRLMGRSIDYNMVDVWDCLWLSTVMGEMHGSAEFIRKCSIDLTKKSNINESQAQELMTSMTVIFKTIHLFNKVMAQVALGEEDSEIFVKLWNVSERFYARYIGVESVSGFKNDFITGIKRMGAMSAERLGRHQFAMKLLKQAIDNGDEKTASMYRKTFSEAGFFIPTQLRAKE